MWLHIVQNKEDSRMTRPDYVVYDCNCIGDIQEWMSLVPQRFYSGDYNLTNVDI